MAEVKISELPLCTTISGEEYFPVVQDGITKRATNYVIKASLPLPSSSLAGYYSMDRVPNYPDDPSGILYLEQTWSATTGWAVASGTIAVSTGKLYFTTTIVSGYISYAGMGSTKNKTIKVCITNSGGYTLQWSDSGTFADMTLVGVNGIEQVWQYTNSTTSGTTTYLGFANAPSGYIAQISQIYIGTGAYSSLLFDNSGNNNAGTITGATLVDGKIGKALAFDGVNDKIVTRYDRGLTTYTIAFWYKGTYKGGDSTAGALVSLERTGGGNKISITTGSTGLARVRWVNASSSTIYLSSGVNISDDIWHHVAFTHDGSVAKIYVDGVLKNTNASTSLIVVATGFGDMNIGVDAALTGFGSGLIDDVRIYYAALTLDEIYALYVNQASNPLAVPMGNAPVPNSVVMRGATGSFLSSAPASASAIGVAGEIAMASGYFYVCIATNQWMRTTISGW